MKAKRRLLDIKVNEISLVDNPANNEHFLIFKRDGGENMDINKLIEQEKLEEEYLSQACKITLDLAARIKASVIKPEDWEKFDDVEKSAYTDHMQQCMADGKMTMAECATKFKKPTKKSEESELAKIIEERKKDLDEKITKSDANIEIVKTSVINIASSLEKILMKMEAEYKEEVDDNTVEELTKMLEGLMQKAEAFEKTLTA